MRFADGNVYAGQWRGGEADGRGTFTFACGTVRRPPPAAPPASRVGQRCPSFHSRPVPPPLLSAPLSAQEYEGQWRADMMDGHGTYRSTNGDVRP